MTDFDPNSIYNNNPIDTTLDTLTYIQSFFDRLNYINSFNTDIQQTPHTIIPYTSDFDFLFDDTDFTPPSSNFFIITLDNIPDLIITLDTNNPNDIILNIDTNITHYSSIDNFLLNHLTLDIIHNRLISQ